MENNNLEQKLNSLEERIKKIEQDLLVINNTNKNDNFPARQKKISIKEFLMTKKLDDDVKRTLAVGYFLENIEKIGPFNSEDLKIGFRLAKIQLPSNINDKINMNIKNGHIMSAAEKKDSKKAWVLTATGENFVKNEL